MIDSEDIDYPTSPTYAGWVNAEHDHWATHIAPRRHLRYDDASEPEPIKAVTPKLYAGISDKDMLTPKQLAQLEREEQERRKHRATPKTSNDFRL